MNLVCYVSFDDYKKINEGLKHYSVKYSGVYTNDYYCCVSLPGHLYEIFHGGDINDDKDLWLKKVKEKEEVKVFDFNGYGDEKQERTVTTKKRRVKVKK